MTPRPDTAAVLLATFFFFFFFYDDDNENGSRVHTSSDAQVIVGTQSQILSTYLCLIVFFVFFLINIHAFLLKKLKDPLRFW